MVLTVRNYAFILIGIFLAMHVSNIIIIEFHSETVNQLLFRSIPYPVFLVIDVVSILSVGILLYGLLTFNHCVVLTWFIYLVIAWHFPFVLIVIYGVMVKYKQITSGTYFMGTLIPGLQICVWSLILIHIFRYWHMLKEFEKLPDYLRTDLTLMRPSHHRYETDKLRKTILTKRQVTTYQYRV